MTRWNRAIAALGSALICAAAAAGQVEVETGTGGSPPASGIYVVSRAQGSSTQPAAALTQDPGILQKLDMDPVLRSLELRKAELQVSLDNAISKFGSRHRTVKNLKDLIEAIQRQIESRRADLLRRWVEEARMARALESARDQIPQRIVVVGSVGPGLEGFVTGLRQLHGQTVKATYLGVAVSPIPGTLRKHLDLPEGVGLLVDHVDPDSPAKAAGIDTCDVLHKLDDQILINFHQLAVLVRTFKPGDEVKLALLRRGKPRILPVKLVEKEGPKLTPPPMWPLHEGLLGVTRPRWRATDKRSAIIYTSYRKAVYAPFDGVLKSVEVKLNQRVKKGQLLGRLDTAELELELKKVQAEIVAHEIRLRKHAGDGDKAEAEITKAQIKVLKAEAALLDNRIGRAELRSPIDGKVAGDDPARRVGAAVKAGQVLFGIATAVELWKELGAARAAKIYSTRTIREDSEHSIAVTNKDGERYLVVKDRAGNVIFQGPIGTPEQGKAVPKQFREKLEKMGVDLLRDEMKSRGPSRPAASGPATRKRPRRTGMTI